LSPPARQLVALLTHVAAADDDEDNTACSIRKTQTICQLIHLPDTSDGLFFFRPV
jgi:hypothetical protein